MKKIEAKEIDDLLKELSESLRIRRYSDATKKRNDTVVRAYLYYEYENGKNLRELTEERAYKPSSYNNVNAILKYFLEIVLARYILSKTSKCKSRISQKRSC